MFKTPTRAAPLRDKAELDARYRYWRRHILITIWLGYALFYFTREKHIRAYREQTPAWIVEFQQGGCRL